MDPGEGFTYGSELIRVVAAVVFGVTVNPVILFMEGAGGRSFQGEVPIPSRER